MSAPVTAYVVRTPEGDWLVYAPDDAGQWSYAGTSGDAPAAMRRARGPVAAQVRGDAARRGVRRPHAFAVTAWVR